MSDVFRENTTTSRPRLALLTEQLKQIVESKASGSKLPTVRDLCAQFHVSARTINAALNELERERLVERVHGVGLFVSQRATRRFLLVGDFSFFGGVNLSPFWNLFLMHARHFASTRGGEVRLLVPCPMVDDGLALDEAMQYGIESSIPDAIIAVGLNAQTTRWLMNLQVPLVTFASSVASEWRVHLDAQELVIQGVQALIQCGCENIEFWKPVGPERRTDEAEGAVEKEVFRQHLRRAGKTYGEQSIKGSLETLQWGIVPHESHREQGFRIAWETFQESSTQFPYAPSRPDGILVTDDMMTVGLLRVLQTMNIEVGRDVKIATHSNLGSPVLSDYEDVLIRIEFDPARIVRALFDILETLLHGEIPAAQNYLLAPKTVWPSSD